MWIWKPLQPRLWHQHSSSEHGSFRRWPEMWSLLPAGMQPTSMVRAWSTSLDCNSHESMSTQLGIAQQRRRVVQSSPPSLRPLSACLHQARPTHCRNCSCLLQKVRAPLSTHAQYACSAGPATTLVFLTSKISYLQPSCHR
jgi:hypothetical protein